MKTVLIVEITHSKPLPMLADLVADRAYKMDGVVNAEAWVASGDLETTRPDHAHEQVLIKLLQIEPETQDQLILATGWDPQETIRILNNLITRDVVSYRNAGSSTGKRRYFVRKGVV